MQASVRHSAAFLQFQLAVANPVWEGHTSSGSQNVPQNSLSL
jgi:hypothetical protein